MRHQVRQHAVDAGRREEQSQAAEKHGQRQRGPSRRQRQVAALLHGVRIEQGQARRNRREPGAHSAQDRAGVAGGLDRQSVSPLDVLRVGHVIRPHRIAVAFHIRSMDGANNPHHGHPVSVLVRLQKVVDILRQIHAPADRVAIRPEVVRQPLVHDDSAWGGFAISLVERAPRQHGDMHGLEVARRNRNLFGRNQRLSRFHDVTFCQDHTVAMVATPGDGGGRTRRRHTGKGADGCQRPVHQRARVGVFRIKRPRHAGGRRHYALDIESRVDTQQLAKACQHQSRACQQHEGQSHLCHYQALPHASRPPAAGARAALFAQHVAYSCLDHLHRRDQPDDDPDQRRHYQHRQHDHAIHADLARARQRFDSAVCQSAQQSRAQRGPRRATGQRHQNVLRH